MTGPVGFGNPVPDYRGGPTVLSAHLGVESDGPDLRWRRLESGDRPPESASKTCAKLSSNTSAARAPVGWAARETTPERVAPRGGGPATGRGEAAQDGQGVAAEKERTGRR